MSNLKDLQVDLKLKVPTDSSVKKEELWVHLIEPGTDKVLAKARLDSSGQAKIKFNRLGDTPPTLEAVVSPLSILKPLNFVKTEKAVISKWNSKDGIWTSGLNISISSAFEKSVNWLNEEFLVTGHLKSRYTDPETDSVVETPVRHAKVKMYDVDKVQIKPSCLPDKLVCKPLITCIPQTLCNPVTEPICLPDKLVCKPLITCIPQTLCKPVIEPICLPKLPIECTPSGPVIPPDIWQDKIEFDRTLKSSGCCGAEITNEVQLRKIANPAPVMKPLSSPALKSVESVIDSLNAKTCIPLILGTTYKKSLLGLECETDDTGYFAITFKRKDFFEAPAGSTHTEDSDWDEFPDLLFEARLWIDGEYRLIYSEIYADTRWNKGTYTHVDLYVNGKIPNCDPLDTGIDTAQTEDFLFHGVGNVQPGWIASDGVIKSAPASTGLNEYVFGGGMDIMGQFQLMYAGKYYQVEYQRNGEGDWHPILGEQWYYSHYLGDGKWETLLKAPESFDGYPACYQILDYTDITITRKTQLITWQSYRTDGNIPRYPNGLYHLRVVLLEKVGTNVQPVAGFDPNANIMHIKIDNSWPVASIAPTLYVGELAGSTLNLSAVAECGIIRRGVSRFLLINFRAEDMENHFLQYRITVNRGADQPLIIPEAGLPAGVLTTPALTGFAVSPSSYRFLNPGDNFNNAYTAMYLGTDPWLPWQTDSFGHLQPQPLKQCAYNFILSVYDRVTNGYGHVHYSQHTMTLTILE